MTGEVMEVVGGAEKGQEPHLGLLQGLHPVLVLWLLVVMG